MTLTLRDRVAGLANETPDSIAVASCGRAPATYRALLRQMDRTAQSLTLAGIRRGDRVAVVMPNGAQMASAFLGIASVGVCAPLNPAYKENEFDFYLSDLKPKLVLVHAELDCAVRGVARAMGIEVVEVHDLPDAEAGGFRLGPEVEETESAVAVRYATPEDVALVLHTSGTTSRPKVVPLTQQNLCVSAGNIAEALALTPQDRCLNIMPLFHIHGLVAAVAASLTAGGSVVCTPGYSATEFFDWLGKFHPTWYTGVPTMHHGIVARADANRAVIAANPLRFIRSSSAALAPTLMAEVETAFGAPVIEAYGMTEAAHQMTTNALPPHSRKPGSVGRPVGLEVAVMDEAGEFQPAGTEGEVVIRGRNVTLGYDQNPEANAKSFTRGWFRTGDNGRFDADGDLFLTGRIKELIVRGGEKIPPREIDEALLSHPAVETALGFGIADAALGERVAAIVVLKAGASATALELREHVAALLADYKVPDRIVFATEIPKGTTGKPQRIGLAERLGLTGAVESKASPYAAPRNEIETQVAGLFAAVLKLNDVGIHDNFFTIGGDSLLASRLIVRLRQTFAAGLTIAQLFESPTIAEVAEIIAADSSGDRTAQVLEPIPDRRCVQLTAAQRRMWFLDRLEPDAPIYNSPAAYRIAGTVDLERLQRSVNQLVEGCELLRTTYQEHNGDVTGVIHETHAVPVSLTDLSHHEPTQLEAAMQDWLHLESSRRFNLTTGPVLRCAVARLAPESHILLLTVHHIASDEATESILLENLAQAWNGTLPAAPAAQFAEYAAWQHLRETTAAGADLAWWKTKLENIEEPAGIPLDHPRPARDRHRGATFRLHLPAAVAGRCKAVAGAHKTTPFAVLLAAFKAVLHRYHPAENIAVGTPVSVRNHPASETMPGLFINTLVLRTSIAGDPTFAEFLTRVRGTVVDALAHQETPFETVVDATAASRSLARSPLFQVFFAFNTAGSIPHWDGLEVQRLNFNLRVVIFDLSVEVEAVYDGIDVSFHYNTDLFEGPTIESCAGNFEQILKQALASPEVKMSGLTPATTEEQERLLDLGRRVTTYAPDKCLHTLFEEQVERTPDALALTFEERSLTYRELNQRANQLASYLRRLGVGPESLVGLYTERSMELVVGVLGILKAGGAYLPIDTVYPAERIQFMLDDAGVSALLTQECLLDKLGQTSARIICLDSDWPAIGEESAANPALTTSPEDLAYVIYTSGSTGKPKGCLVTHYNVARLMQGMAPAAKPVASDVWVLFHSHAFDFSVWEMWGALLYGGRLVVVPQVVSRSPALFRRLLRDEGVTFLNQTPSAFRQLIQADLAADGDRLPLRMVTLGGEALEVRTLRPWFEKYGDQTPQLLNAYGITETTVIVTWRPLSLADTVENTGSFIGSPIPDLSLYLLDEHMRPVPAGMPGEIFVGGAGVARGYLRRPELTQARFLPDPFSTEPGARLYRSGDQARRLANGEIEYLGRIDQQLKIRGFRVELGEIEMALRQHPDVRDAIVNPQGKDADMKLVAYVVPRTQMPSIAALRGFLSATLPDHMVPAAFVALNAIPLNANGKADRGALAAPTAADILDGEAYVAPGTQLQKDLAAIWQDSIGVERVGLHDNFFHIGGNSLTAMRVVVRIRSAFGIDIPVASIFQCPTLDLLAAAVDELRSSDHSEEELLRMLAEIDEETASSGASS